MQEFTNKVAVVTGGASGIGKALAAKCLDEGMQVVLADVEENALAKTTEEFQAAGSNSVLPVVTNVARKAEIEALAKKAVDEFGGVHLLFNNAGVGAGTNPQETTYDDWEWVMGANTGVSVLCPGFISTNIMDSSRNRPSDLPDETVVELTPEMEARREMFENMIINGMPPAELAEIVFDGIRAKRLYILTGPEFNEIIQQRANQITSGTNPDLGLMPFQE